MNEECLRGPHNAYNRHPDLTAVCAHAFQRGQIGRKPGADLSRTARVEACEHMFVTTGGSAQARFVRAIERRSVLNAELAARELGHLVLADALSLVLLYAATDDPRFDRAATRWAGRFCVEETPSLSELQAAVAALALVKRGGGEAAARLLIGLCRR